ncbi:putative bifunctional diguanylate cyclase/phosphodiesterase [Rubrobacter indicoceani]|uniref:putative bifunctional diguanylate cyclase/phosphodiesterase n=1 Tax=Rubrobacter indicoceani TaxID=2051957 RepID=UPI0013C3F182|nr:EAL domain-containing protein [Rubrobacter indicoceani]
MEPVGSSDPFSLLASLTDGVYVTDANLSVIAANPALLAMTGYPAEEITGRDAHELFHHTNPAGGPYRREDSPVYRTLTTGQAHRISRESLWSRDGTGLPVEYTCSPIKAGGDTTGVIVIFRDTAARRRRERLAREREERFRVLFQNSSDIILVSDARRVVRYASPSVERLVGHRPEDLVGGSLLDLLHPDDAEEVVRVTDEARRKGGLTRPVELRWRRADGAWRTSEMIVSNLFHEPTVRGLVMSIRDVTDRKVLEEHIAHQAFHDALTGLPNRSLFMDRLTLALKRSKRSSRAVATLFMDLDNFKVINDTLGHEAGDNLLVEIARRLKICLRESDTAARFGGDEFTVLLEDINGEDDALMVARRIRDEVRKPFVLAGREVFVTTSLGISLNIYGDEAPTDLLRHADIAVYDAKKQGRNRYAVFVPEMNARVTEQLILGNDLGRALERNEFVVLYQPNVSLSSGRIVAVEALLNWDHPDRGRLAPGQFIPIAEQTGTILPIGLWVLEEACRQARAWDSLPGHPPVNVSVNLSALQLRSRDFPGDVRRILRETELESSRLSIEISEGLLSDVASVAESLSSLKELGVGLALDDFGTGNSSLSTLRELPLDTLKIDRYFVDDLKDDGAGTGVVKALVELAHTLGLRVVAEGVETSRQLSLLREMGCEVAQGYHISRPVEAEAAGRLITSGLRWT